MVRSRRLNKVLHSVAYLAGPTGGYLFGMLLAAAMVETLAQRATARPAMLLGVMTLGSTLIYATGAAWLVGFVGLSRAFASGIIPFLAGDAAKAALATALVLAAARVRRP